MVALQKSECSFQSIPPRPSWRNGIVAASHAMQHLLDQVERIAPSSLPVLLLGETGTGKEVLARALHQASGRPGSFVAVNCATLPTSLAESELFGHVRGAFTGADRLTKGLIEEAHHGTLFLDEVVDVDPLTQAKLLRVIEDGEIRPLGATRTIRVQIRIVCATNRDIEAAVRDGRFREDLYYRLSGLVLKIPPLRERKEDIGPLVDKFLKERNEDCPNRARPCLVQGTLSYLESHPWPGNVRELRLAVQRAVVLGNAELQPVDFGLGSGLTAQKELPTACCLRPPTWKQASRANLLSAIERHGSVAAAARSLGVPKSTAHDWVRASRAIQL